MLVANHLSQKVVREKKKWVKVEKKKQVRKAK